MSKATRILLMLGCACFLAGLPLFSQVNSGRILGTITDQTGGVIAGAMVTVTNAETGVARNLVADQAGEYVAPNLNPGTYTVRASASGFQTFQRQNITLGLGQDARVDAQLAPGEVTQTVEVTASTPLLDTTSAVVSGTLGTDTIADLPMKARNFQDLLTLRPGVVQTPGGGTLTTAVHGLAPSQNNNFIEGLDSNDPLTGQNITNTTLPWGDAATILPVDAIQELNVETNAPAEFGRRPGAVINVGLKTGGNAIHGSAFAYGRDSAMNANDYVNPLGGPPSLKQPMNLEQWGGTVGGPIIKNKLFYFGAFERETYSVGNAASSSTPTSASIGDANQSVPDAIAALNAKCPGASWCGQGSGVIDGVSATSVSPLSAAMLQYFGPNNNPTSSSIILGPGQNTAFTINNVVGKVDYHPTDHHTFTTAYFFGGGDTTGGYDANYTLAQFDSIGKMRAEFLTTSWTWTPNSTWVNDVRFGWNHYLRNTQTGDFLTPVTSYGLNTGVTDPQLQGFPLITIANFGSSAGGGPKSPRNFGPGNDFDFVDHVSYLRGKHAFKFGGEMLYLRTFFDQIPNGRGTFTFTGGKNVMANGTPYWNGNVTNPLGTGITDLEAYLAGLPDANSGGSLLEGSPARTYTQWDYSGFFEDSWRATSKVTVNAGVRYEYATPISEIHNLIGNWSLANGLEQVGVNGLKSAYNAYSKDISPRLGIAWDISGKGTTVVRVGGGIYYDNPASAQFIGLQGTLPGGQIGIDAIPTGSLLYAANGSFTGPIVPNGGGMSTQTVNISGQNLNWVLNGKTPIFPAFSPTSLACGNGLAPVNPVAGAPAKNPGGCSIFATSPNLPSPMITSWNLGVQHALTPTLALDVNYIGNHGGRLPGVTDLNQATGAGLGGGPGVLPLAAQYPYLAFVDYMQDNEISNYNGVEVTLTARSFHRLSFLAGYDFSHALTEEPGTGYGLASPQNNLNPMGDYGPTNFDVRHHFSFTPSYILPSKKWHFQLLEGWSVQSAILATSGLPWNAASTKNLSGSLEKKDRWDFFGNPGDFTQTSTVIPFYPGSVTVNGATIINPSLPSGCVTNATAIGTYSAAATTAANVANSLFTYGCYSQGSSVMIAPPANTFGTASRNEFRGPDYIDWDFSLFKSIKFTERLNAQFRVEAFNILNHKILYQGNTNPNGSNFGCACETPDQAQTNPVLGLGGARNLQLGLKLMF